MRKPRRGNISFVAFGAVLLAVLPADAQRLRRHSLDVDGVRREYLVHAAAPADQPLPVVFLFHGGGGNAQSAARRYGWLELARRTPLVLVVPDGLDRGWNDLGRIHGDARDDNDDVAFMRALIEQLTRSYRIDRARMYATGHSNGAFFTYTLACALPGVFAAIGPVAGSIGSDHATSCPTAQSLSLMHVHGTADPLVRFAGGRTPSGNSMAVRNAVGYWAKVNGCGDPVQQSSKSITIQRYARCSDGAEVILYAISGFGHEWPTAEKGGFAATEALWRFFQEHARQ